MKATIILLFITFIICLNINLGQQLSIHKGVIDTHETTQEKSIGIKRVTNLLDYSIKIKNGDTVKTNNNYVTSSYVMFSSYTPKFIDIPSFLQIQINKVIWRTGDYFTDLTLTADSNATPGNYKPKIEFNFYMGSAIVNTVTLQLNVTIYNQPPEKSQLVFPTNNTVNQHKNIVLKWNSQPTAILYIVQLSSDQFFSSIAKSDTTSLDTIKINGLLAEKKYYWRVQARNSAGVIWSDTWNFTTALEWVKTTAPSNFAIKCFEWSGGYLYTGTDGGGIFRSLDEGLNWSPVNDGLTELNVSALLIEGNNLFAGTTHGRIFLSTNNGSNWTLIKTISYSAIDAFAKIENNLFAATNSYLYISKDYGQNWTNISNSNTPSNIESLTTQGKNLFVGGRYGVGFSTDNGNTWKESLIDYRVNCLIITNSVQLVGTDNYVNFRSTDSGLNWVLMSAGSQSFTSFVKCGQYVFASSSYDLNQSLNNGISWTSVDLNFTNSTRRKLGVSLNYLFAGTYSDGIWRRRLIEMTGVNPPVKPQLLSPTMNKTFSASSVSFKWNNSKDATFYLLQLSKDQSFSSIVKQDSIAADTTITVIKLSEGTKYYWRLQAKNEAGISQWSDVWNFTTIVALPTKPILILPNSNLVNQPCDITFKWNKTKDTDKYFIQLSKDQTFATITKSDSTTTDTLKTISGLDNKTKYYWRVRAKNVAGFGDWSDFWNFTTIVALPQKPILILPISNQVNQPINLTLKWVKTKDTDKYIIQLSKDQSFTSITKSDSTSTDTAKAITGLENNTKYYWRVKTKNVAGLGDWSDVWNFTTIVALPIKPVLALQNNLINQPKDVTLKWNKVKDADKYIIQVAKDQSYTTTTNIDSTTTDTMKTISGFVEGQKYYWKVQAKNIAGASPWSDIWNFTTLITSPSNLVLMRTGLKELTLKWNDNSNNEDGYLIERKQSPATSFSFLDSLKTSATSYTDKKVEQGLTYNYRMRAYTKFAQSDYSNEASIIVVGIEKEELPTVYSLAQNYPNPFNPTTKIKFGLPESATAKLTIYDLLGREVATLINGELTAGYHEYEFNAGNLSSGIYFYRIVTPKFTSVKKLLLMK